MKKYILLTNIIFILIAFSCKKETPLPDKAVISYSLIDISPAKGYQIKLNIDNYDASLNQLFSWDLGTGKFYNTTSSTQYYNKVYSKSGDLTCYFNTKGPHNIKLTATNENGETINNTSLSIKVSDTIANFQGTINSGDYINQCKFYIKPYDGSSSSTLFYTCTGNYLTSYNYNFTLNLENNAAIAPLYGKKYIMYVLAYYGTGSYYYNTSNEVTFTLSATNRNNFTAN